MINRLNLFVIIVLTGLFNSCTFPPLQCLLEYSDYEKQYNFNFSKEELKNRIIEAYSYDVSVTRKVFGINCIEEVSVNQKYRQNIYIWLDKSNWDKFKSEIRNNTQDTLTIIISKHLSRKELKFRVLIDGDVNKSALTIQKIEYRQPKKCDKDKTNYQTKFEKKIKTTFIDKLK